jgi:L-lactate dehydrogenase complex protein LldF
VKIPLPKIMRYWRAREYAAGLAPKTTTFGLSLWAYAAKRPALYRAAASLAARTLRTLAGSRGTVRAIPLMYGWFVARNFPAPQGKTFHELWKARK